jgi:peroxiredoxin Q/BCP
MNTEYPYPAPEFSLPNAHGDTVSLKDFAGQWLVGYFYPKDATPGCTVEACSMQDVTSELEKLDARVVGISADGAESHQKFASKHNLTFDLLTDADGKVAEAYGAWGKKMLGTSEGMKRKTYIVDPDGQVAYAFEKVNPSGHGQEVAGVLAELKRSRDASAYGAGTF